MAAYIREAGGASVVPDYSAVLIGPTLRAVQGANPYLLVPTNLLGLGTLTDPSSLSGQGLSHCLPAPGRSFPLFAWTAIMVAYRPLDSPSLRSAAPVAP